MNAILLAYSANSEYIVQAKENGAISVNTVYPDDGSPDKLVFEYTFHKKEIGLLDFLTVSTFISMDESGNIRIVDFISGKEIATCRIENKFKVCLSPDKQFLFLLTGNFEVCVRKYSLPDLSVVLELNNSFDKFYVPQTRLLGVSADTCVLQTLHSELGESKVEEIVGIVDFEKNCLNIREFERTIIDDFNWDKVPFAIHAFSGAGARLDFNQPVEITDGSFCSIKAELFDLYTLKTIKYILLCKIEQEPGEVQRFLENDPDSKSYRKAQQDLYGEIVSLRFSPDGNTLWASYSKGACNAVNINTGKRSRWILNAGRTEKGIPNINSIFDYSLHNNTVLYISPGQEYVVFSYPNCFFRADLPFQEGDMLHPVAPRQMISGEGMTEVVSFAGFTRDGKYMVVSHEAGYIFVIDMSTSRREYKMVQPHIACINEVDHANGVLSFAVSGANAYCIKLKGNGQMTTNTLFIPPHSIATRAIASDKVLFIHNSGAVVLLYRNLASINLHYMSEPLNFQTEAISENALEMEGINIEEDGESDANYYDYFESHIPAFGGTFFYQAGILKAATINEDGHIHVYSLKEEVMLEYESQSDGFGHNFIAGNGNYILAGNFSHFGEQGYILLKNEKDNLSRVDEVEDQDLRFCYLKESKNAILKFNQATGAFTETDIESGNCKILFTYSGSKIEFIKYNEATNRLLFVEGNCCIQVIDLKSRKIESSWELKAMPNDKELKRVKTQARHFKF
jgi:WD40 repeat protein